MAKDQIRQWSITAGNNTDIDGTSIAENCAIANWNNAMRSVMSDTKAFWDNGFGYPSDKSASFTADATDNEVATTNDNWRFFNCTAALTLTLPTATTTTAGWGCIAHNNSTGVLTIDPGSTDTLNGSTSNILVGPGETILVKRISSSAYVGTILLDISATEMVLNDAGSDRDLRVEGDTDDNLLFLDAGNDRVGVGTGTLTNKFTVASTTATTADTVDVMDVVGQSSGTAAANFGAAVRFVAELSTGTNAAAGRLGFAWEDPGGAGVNDSYFTLDTVLNNAAAEALNISSAGHHRKPLNAAFQASNSLQDDQATGDGTAATVDFDTEAFDQGGNFAADTFTAPITGRYLLCATVDMRDLTASHTGGSIVIVTTLTSYTIFNGNIGAMRNASNLAVISGSVIADMTAGNTATVTCTVSGSTKTVDIGVASRFFGVLIS